MAVVKVWGRGQLTIPASLRKELNIEEETTFDLIKAGESLVLTPRRILGDRVAKLAQRQMKKEGLSLDDLLSELERQRERYIEAHYGD